MKALSGGSEAVNRSDGPFRYNAFISYASARGKDGDPTALDRAVATRLTRLLETYRTPKRLLAVAHGSLPRLQRVFRDRDELNATCDLTAAIQAALRSSRWLIVVCSPHAAQSRWVNEELNYFAGLGAPGHTDSDAQPGRDAVRATKTPLVAVLA